MVGCPYSFHSYAVAHEEQLLRLIFIVMFLICIIFSCMSLQKMVLMIIKTLVILISKGKN